MRFSGWVYGMAALLLVTFIPAVGLAGGGSSCDERKVVDDTTTKPRNAVTLLRYEEGDGKLGAYASGSLISPYAVLTCGHCVWNRKKSKYNMRPMHIMPGAFRTASNKLEAPFGVYVLTDTQNDKRTNKTFRKKKKSSHDYGAMLMHCPFDHLQTYMPLAFEAEREKVRVSGYPIESLPEGVKGGSQLTDMGEVTDDWGRVMHYDTRSTGGASGAPTMVYDAPTRTYRQVAINTHHTNKCDGGAAKLVKQNKDLVLTWMKFVPTASQRKAAGCRRVPARTSWKGLKKKYKRKGIKLIGKKRLKLKKKPLVPKLSADTEIYQIIEGQLYHWLEYNDSKKRRYVRMKAPSDGWLTPHEARVLLTASSKWARSKDIRSDRRKVVDMGRLKAITMPTVKNYKPSKLKGIDLK